MKNSFATILNELSVLKLFQLLNGDLLFSQHAYSTYKVRKPRMTKLGQSVEVRAHYPSAQIIHLYIILYSVQCTYNTNISRTFILFGHTGRQEFCIGVLFLVINLTSEPDLSPLIGQFNERSYPLVLIDWLIQSCLGDGNINYVVEDPLCQLS